MPKEDYKLKEVLETFLSDLLNVGVRAAIISGPDGFPVYGIGKFDDVDEKVSSFVSGIPPVIKREVNKGFSLVISGLTGKHMSINDIVTTEFVLSHGDRKYIVAYVEGYTIVSPLDDSVDLSRVRDTITQVSAKVISFFRELREKAGWEVKIEEKPSEPTITREEIAMIRGERLKEEIKEESVEVIERLKDPRYVYQKVRELVLEIRESLLQKGDWASIIDDFRTLANMLNSFIELNEEYADSPIITTIVNWVNKTKDRIEVIYSKKGNSQIDANKKETLKRGLMQLITYLRRALF